MFRILGSAAPVALTLIFAGSTAAVADPETEYTMDLSSSWFISAITLSSDPIGTTADFALTVTGG
jgi:hypothetical protein